MLDPIFRGRSSVRVLLIAAAGSLAAMTALGAGPDGSGDSRVVRVRRGGGGDGGVEVTRSVRAVRAEQADRGEAPSIAPSGAITPDPGADGLMEDVDPVAAGLPDAEAGVPETQPPGQTPHAEQIEFYDIGVRGKRSGRTIILWGAEFAFVNCEILVADGLPVGYTGVIGEVGVNPGSSSVMEFTLQCGGEITLTVQPAAIGSPATPNRPVRTITMQVP